MSNPHIAVVSATDHEDDSLDVIISVMNRFDLVRKYSEEVATTIDHELVIRFQEIVDDKSTIVIVSPGQVVISRLVIAGMSISRTNACIEMLLRHVILGDFKAKKPGSPGLVALAALEVAVSPSKTLVSDQFLPKIVRIPASEAHMHLMHANWIVNAMQKGQLDLAYQPVFNVYDRGDILYKECKARVMVQDSNCVILPSSFLPSIERAHLTSELDRLVLHKVIETLEIEDRISLACDISAQSAIEMPWWDAIFERLNKRPDVAERMVLEIQETAPLVPFRARRLLRRLGERGVRIAIDGFGYSYGVQTSIEVLNPSIVKIDASFLRDVRTGANGLVRLRGLAELAKELAHVVIIQGVEDDVDLRVVDRIGCKWAQGLFDE